MIFSSDFFLPQAVKIFGGLFLVLLSASAIGMRLKQQKGSTETITNLNERIYAWWLMSIVLLLGFLFGKYGTIALFYLISFAALREFMTLVYRHRADYYSMVACFYVILPIQYYFVFAEWYGMFSVFIPVYGFLFLPIIASLSGETSHFLERTAKTQWAAIVCIFCISHVPALLLLKLDGIPPSSNILLLIFLILIVQSSDVLQYIWGKLLGGAKIMPALSPSKTISGTVGGISSAVGLAIFVSPLTPFLAWQAALIALAICVMGFLGGLVMSAIKRDHDIKDWGNLLQGHGGMLDRVDSICFAAPVYFHILRYFWHG